MDPLIQIIGLGIVSLKAITIRWPGLLLENNSGETPIEIYEPSITVFSPWRQRNSMIFTPLESAQSAIQTPGLHGMDTAGR